MKNHEAIAEILVQMNLYTKQNPDATFQDLLENLGLVEEKPKKKKSVEMLEEIASYHSKQEKV